MIPDWTEQFLMIGKQNKIERVEAVCEFSAKQQDVGLYKKAFCYPTVVVIPLLSGVAAATLSCHDS